MSDAVDLPIYPLETKVSQARAKLGQLIRRREVRRITTRSGLAAMLVPEADYRTLILNRLEELEQRQASGRDLKDQARAFTSGERAGFVEIRTAKRSGSKS